MAAQPDHMAVSVVVPLVRGRQAQLDGLAAWTRQQLRGDPDSDGMEIVAVSPGLPETDAAARARLRAQDRLLVVPGAGEIELVDAGARAARGRVLVLTECHCVPRAGCLVAALTALDGGIDVACFESATDALSAAAWVEDGIFQSLFERLVDAGDPRAISLRGMALRAGLYARSGGLRLDDHECFAERVLAARLASTGARVGRAHGATVEHMPNKSFREARRDSLAFCRSEVKARLVDAGEIDPNLHLEPSIEWDRRARFDRSLNRGALPGLARLALGRGDPGDSARRAFPGAAARAVAGRRGAAAAAAVRSRMLSSASSAQWLFRRRPDPAPTWDGISRASMLRALADRPASDLRPQLLDLAAAGGSVGARHLDRHAFGLHSLERLDGEEFRWTEPVLGLSVAGSLTGRTIALRLLPVRALESHEVAVAWGHRRLDAAAISVQAGRLAVELPPGGSAALVVVVQRFRAPGDTRRLGLPLTAIGSA